jgi:hypothetical protein
VKRIRVIFAAVGLAAAASLTAATPGQAAQDLSGEPAEVVQAGSASLLAAVPIGPFTIWNKGYANAGRGVICLDIPYQSGGALATAVQTWKCDAFGNSPWQLWNALPLGNGNFILSSAYYNDRCLDAETQSIGRNGTKVQIYRCTGAPNQVWYQWLTGGRQFWVNAQSRRCLDIDATDPGLHHLQLWDCTQAFNQDWRPTIVVSP